LPYFDSKTNSTITDIEITTKDRVDIIITFAVNKASGPDGISNKMLKLVANEIYLPLSILFNESLNTCMFPDICEFAYVIPLFKTGEPSLAEKYRPISLLSCIGKIFERTVFEYICKYLISNNLLYKLQIILPRISLSKFIIEYYWD